MSDTEPMFRRVVKAVPHETFWVVEWRGVAGTTYRSVCNVPGCVHLEQMYYSYDSGLDARDLPTEHYVRQESFEMVVQDIARLEAERDRRSAPALKGTPVHTEDCEDHAGRSRGWKDRWALFVDKVDVLGRGMANPFKITGGRH